MKYGFCKYCYTQLEPVWFEDMEEVYENGHQCQTGRWRKAVDYLICPNCLKKECVDDTFDGAYHY
jgi:hypothetical protein